jgi:hypothetical protein
MPDRVAAKVSIHAQGIPSRPRRIKSRKNRRMANANRTDMIAPATRRTAVNKKFSGVVLRSQLSIHEHLLLWAVHPRAPILSRLLDHGQLSLSSIAARPTVVTLG